MREEYSFLLTRAGKILDGGGLTESHSEMASLHKVDEDKCNRYEWHPPEGWPDAEVLDGLVKDSEVFTPGASALKRIAAHLTARFPTVDAFSAPTPVDERWHEQTVTIDGHKLVVICRPVSRVLTNGTFLVCGQTVEARGNATVKARGNATVKAGDNATVEAWDNATVVAWGNATVKARDNATVKAGDNATVVAWGNATVKARDNATVKAGGNATVVAWGNATVIYPANWWYHAISTTLADMAVLIDRRNGGLVITRGDES